MERIKLDFRIHMIIAGMFLMLAIFLFPISSLADEAGHYHWITPVSKHYTGLAQEASGTWYYLRDGDVDFTYSDLVEYYGTWYYVKDGILDWNYSTLSQVHKHGTWYYVDHGQINWNYTGLYQYQGDWYFIQNGVWNRNFNDLWYQFGGWWYVRNGKIDWSYSNLVQYYGTWYYVKNGAIDWNYSTLSQVNGAGAWYYVEHGQINWNYTGLFQYYGTWYFIENGVLNWGFNDLWYQFGKWWYVKNGAIDWKYTNLVPYYGSWYYVRNGQIDWNATTLAQVNGKGTRYYIHNGVLDWSYNGLIQYKKVWYGIVNGVMDPNFTGMRFYNNMWFYVKKGTVDWNYTGWFADSGVLFYVEKGRAVTNTWKTYQGETYYFGPTGYMTTGSALIDGRYEVFRMDGRWIDTKDMDSKALLYNSATQYLILTSLQKRVTKIYQRNGYTWVPVQAYLCTVGNTSKGWGSKTGEYRVGYSSWGNPETRGYSFNDNEGHTLYYWVRYCDDFLFHSQLYDYGTFNLTTKDNALGEALSHGCIRLQIDDARWLYDHVPDASRVVVY